MDSTLSHRADRKARQLVDRHYSRQTRGSTQFVRPGSCLVLWRPGAVWVSVWQDHVMHRWGDRWECTVFRNESDLLSSDLIRQAVRATVWKFGSCPGLTFVDPSEVGDGEPGYCFRCAGWRRDGQTDAGKYAWTLDNLPDPCAPVGAQLAFA
jgi:hypothetical protein